MSKKDHFRVNGVVTKVMGPGILLVDIGRNRTVEARISGKLMHHKVKIIPRDRVLVGVSPYDVGTGLVLWKHDE